MTQTTPLPERGEPPEAVPSPLARARAETRRLLRRWRRQAMPLAAIGATHAVGWVAAAMAGASAVAVVAAGWAAVVGVYGYARARAGRWGRVYAALACTTSMVWQAAAAVVGAAGVMPVVLWLAGAALAIPWWVRHAEPTPDVAAELTHTPAPPQPPEQPDWRIMRWGIHLAGKTKPLAASRLNDVCDIPYGWRATVTLPYGQHWSKVAGLLPTIASVYDLPDGRVLVEPIPGEAVRHARLVVLTANPLEQVSYWPGPGLDPDAGTFPIAVTADGHTLHLRLWWPGEGTCHTLIAGTTGAGKSTCLDLVLSEIANCDRLYPVLIDGSGGMSVPDWVDTTPRTATGVADATTLLRRLVAMMDARDAHRAQATWTDHKGRTRRGLRSIDPTPTTPGIVIIIDEAHRLLMDDTHGRDIRRQIEQLTQMGRKDAIAVVLVTQQPSIVQLGGSSVIRQMCKTGNVIAFRTAERVSSGMVTDTPPPEPLERMPAQWPDGSPTHGLCYILTQRLIRARTLLVDDPYEQAAAMATKRLDPATAAVGDTRNASGDTAGPATHPTPAAADLHVITHDGVDVATTVRHTLDDGTPPDIAAVMHATGLPLRAVKHALTRISEGRRAP